MMGSVGRKRYSVRTNKDGGFTITYDARAVVLPPGVEFYEGINDDGSHTFYDVTAARALGQLTGVRTVPLPAWSPEYVLSLYDDLDVARAAGTNLAEPGIAVELESGTHNIIDGWHRLYKAVTLGVRELPYHVLTSEMARTITLGTLAAGAPTVSEAMRRAAAGGPGVHKYDKQGNPLMNDTELDSALMSPSHRVAFREAQRLLGLQTPEDRLALVRYLTAGFCAHCGATLPPGEVCHCTNDE